MIDTGSKGDAAGGGLSKNPTEAHWLAYVEVDDVKKTIEKGPQGRRAGSWMEFHDIGEMARLVSSSIPPAPASACGRSPKKAPKKKAAKKAAPKKAAKKRLRLARTVLPRGAWSAPSTPTDSSTASLSSSAATSKESVARRHPGDPEGAGRGTARRRGPVACPRISAGARVDLESAAHLGRVTLDGLDDRVAKHEGIEIGFAHEHARACFVRSVSSCPRRAASTLERVLDPDVARLLHASDAPEPEAPPHAPRTGRRTLSEGNLKATPSHRGGRRRIRATPLGSAPRAQSARRHQAVLRATGFTQELLGESLAAGHPSTRPISEGRK